MTRLWPTSSESCAEFAKWPTAKAESVIASVKSLESLSDMSKLVPALTS